MFLLNWMSSRPDLVTEQSIQFLDVCGHEAVCGSFIQHAVYVCNGATDLKRTGVLNTKKMQKRNAAVYHQELLRKLSFSNFRNIIYFTFFEISLESRVNVAKDKISPSP